MILYVCSGNGVIFLCSHFLILYLLAAATTAAVTTAVATTTSAATTGGIILFWKIEFFSLTVFIAPPSGCNPWDGSQLSSGVRIQIYAPSNVANGKPWLNYAPIYGGSHPYGLLFAATAG